MPVRPDSEDLGVAGRSLTKAMLRPSGDQAGSPSLPLCLVNRRISWPSARMTKISGLPVRSLTNAIEPRRVSEGSAGPTRSNSLPATTAVRHERRRARLERHRAAEAHERPLAVADARGGGSSMRADVAVMTAAIRTSSRAAIRRKRSRAGRASDSALVAPGVAG